MSLSDLIFGKYRLLEPIGQGGMAEVYKALSVGAAGFSRPVVIKKIRPALSRSRQFVNMFIKEANIVASLDHPNVVQVFDLGEHEGDLFMVLEYVPGVTMATVAEHFGLEGRPLPPPIAAFIAVDVCKALECAHGHRDQNGSLQPVVHRDVSPQNVLLSFDGMVKLADFGLALDMGSVRETLPGVIKGKIGYMSPEQARAVMVFDHRTDLFSLGIVLYEALSGRRAFVGQSLADTLRRVREVSVPPLPTVAPSVPSVLADLVARMMSESPDDRPQTAGEVRRVLASYLRGVTPPVDATVLADVVRRVSEARRDRIGSEPSSPDEERTRAEIHPDDLSSDTDAATDAADEDGRMTLLGYEGGEGSTSRRSAPPPAKGAAATAKIDDERATERFEVDEPRLPVPPQEAPPEPQSRAGEKAAGGSGVVVSRVITISDEEEEEG